MFVVIKVIPQFDQKEILRIYLIEVSGKQPEDRGGAPVSYNGQKRSIIHFRRYNISKAILFIL